MVLLQLMADLAAICLPVITLLQVPTELEVSMERLDHMLQMEDTITLKDAAENKMMTSL
jgi:hypothetical protein